MFTIALLSGLLLVNGRWSGDLLATDYAKIAVIGDIHGDVGIAIGALHVAFQELVPTTTITQSDFYDIFMGGERNDPPLYSGPDRFLIIQMGDIIDRGPYSKKCIEVFASASAILGIPVRSLLGNHEAAALAGITPPSWIHADDDLDRRALKKEHDPIRKILHDSYYGMIRLRGLGSDNDASTLFVHAGMDMNWLYEWSSAYAKKEDEEVDDAEWWFDFVSSIAQFLNTGSMPSNKSPVEDEEGWFDVAQINSKVHEIVATRDGRAIRRGLLSSDSMLSTRLFQEATACEDVEYVLRAFQVARVVVGHTPTLSKHIEGMCDKKIIFTDVGMSRWMAGSRGLASVMMMKISSRGKMKELWFKAATIASPKEYQH